MINMIDLLLYEFYVDIRKIIQSPMVLTSRFLTKKKKDHIISELL